MNDSNNSVTPPILPLSDKVTNGNGQRLLIVLRLLDSNPTDTGSLEEAISILQTVNASTQRQGLLQGNDVLAEKILAHRSGDFGSTNQMKRNICAGKRPRPSKVNDDLLHLNKDLIDSTTDAGPALDVQLLISALQRILSNALPPNTGNENLNDAAVDATLHNSLMLVALASDLLAASCCAITSRRTADKCTVAEYELVATSGKQLLSGLEKSAREILRYLMEKDSFIIDTYIEELVYGIQACFKAAIAMIILFGTKLSRSTSILKGLRLSCWTGITLPNSLFREKIVECSVKLLAALPFAGGIDNRTPSELWNQSLNHALFSLFHVMHEVINVVGLSASHFPIRKENIDDEIVKTIENFIEELRRTNSQNSRAEHFLGFLYGLITLCCSLISLDGFSERPSGGTNALTMAQVDCSTILHLVDAMMSFSSTSEGTYHTTKKRLRAEPVEGGLLSPTVIVGAVANRVKLYGHQLFDTYLNFAGPPTLFPVARLLQRVAHAALLSSSSATVRIAVDPSCAMQYTGKYPRWLHNSLVLRIAAVQSMRNVVHAFGCDPGRAPHSTSLICSRDVEHSLCIICGFLLEELSQVTSRSEEWGLLSEKARFLSSCAETLTTSLSSGGEFLSMGTRDKVESVSCLCLSTLMEKDISFLITYGCVRASFIWLGCSCLATPWQDGARSSVLSMLLAASRRSCHDPDPNVMQAANFAIRLCDVTNYSRVPALNVVTRTGNNVANYTMETFHFKLLTSKSIISDSREARNNESEMVFHEFEKSPESIKKCDTKSQATKSSPGIDDTRNVSQLNMSTAKQSKQTEDKIGDPRFDTVAPMAETQSTPPTKFERIGARPYTHESTDLPEANRSYSKEMGPESDDELPKIVDCGPDDDDI